MREFTGFKHGVNLGGWLSQCDHTKERYDSFVTEKDIETIKSWGLDHVRVPVDYDLIEEKDGTVKEYKAENLPIKPLEYKAMEISNIRPVDILPIIGQVEA